MAKNAELMSQMTGMWRTLTVAEQDKWLATNGLARADSVAPGVNALVLTPARGTEVVAVVAGGSAPHTGAAGLAPRRYMDKANPPRHGQALRLVDVTAQPEVHPPAPMLNVSGVRVTDAEIRAWFDELDTNKNGWLSKEEFRAMYKNLDTMGTPVRESYIEEQLKKMQALDDERITFDEFAYLVLHIAQR